MGKLEDLISGSWVVRPDSPELWQVRLGRQIAEDVVQVELMNERGDIELDFADAKTAAQWKTTPVDGLDRLLSLNRNSYYPGMIPWPVEDLALVYSCIKRLRSRGTLHKVVQVFIGEFGRRLSPPMATVAEIYAVTGARSDAISVEPGGEILWEVFGTTGRVEEDLRKLERDHDPSRLKVAVVVDPEVDEALFARFTRSRQGSAVTTWLRVSDLMVVERVENAIAILSMARLRSSGPALRDELELVGFGLSPTCIQWKFTRAAMFGFSGQLEADTQGLEDPLLWVDLRNIGNLEARIGIAYIDVHWVRLFPTDGLQGFAVSNLAPCT